MSSEREVDGFTPGSKYKLKRNFRWFAKGTVVTPTSAGKGNETKVVVGASGSTIMVNVPGSHKSAGLFVDMDWLEAV